MTDRDEREDRAAEREGDDEAMLERLLAQPFPLGDLVRQDAARELARREGEWDAFTAAVFRRADEAAVEVRRMSLEERAVAAMKAEVETELGDLAPRFEGAFQREIEDRIWREAKARPSVGAAIAGWLESVKTRLFDHPRLIGLAAAGAAAALALAVAVPRIDPGVPGTAPGGQVRVDRVSFEGTVTVMEEGAITVVWLAGDAAS